MNRNKSRRLVPQSKKIIKGYVEDWNTTKKKQAQDGARIVNVLPFSPVSIILAITENLLLSKETSYDMKFNTGILEGTGISVNSSGNMITFQEAGSYRFEISGEAVVFSDVEVTLSYISDNFGPDLKPFTDTIIPKLEDKLQLRGIPTILPLDACDIVIPRLIPNPDESILLLTGTRLLIHRVA